MEFWERLRELRAEQGETQLQVAKEIGMTSRQYQGLEAGSSLPSYKSFLVLADHFEVSLDYLAGRSDKKFEFNYNEFKLRSQEGIMEIFAERLKNLRIEERRSSKEMAEYLGVSQRAYLYYESAGHYPDVPGLIKLADYFGVTTDYLLGRSDQR